MPSIGQRLKVESSKVDTHELVDPRPGLPCPTGV